MKKLCGLFAVIAFGSTLAAAPSHAATSACSNFSPDVTGFVSNISACEISDTVNNDNPSAAFLAEGWFGITDWTFVAKDDDPVDGTIDEGSGLVISVNAVPDALPCAGLWSITGYDSSLNYMLVRKGGTSADPSPLVTYLVSAGSGAYMTPFIIPGTTTAKAISHISLYVTAIPLPAALPLFLVALGGLGLVARRRRKVTAA